MASATGNTQLNSQHMNKNCKQNGKWLYAFLNSLITILTVDSVRVYVNVALCAAHRQGKMQKKIKN